MNTLNLTTPAPRRRLALTAVLAASALGLSACATSSSTDPASSAAPAGGSESSVSAAASGSTGGESASSAASSATSASSSMGSESGASSSAGSATAETGDAALTVTDPWTKATDAQMTGSFGTLTNTTDEDLHVVSVTSETGSMTELHEMVEGESGQMIMQEAPDGFTIPAGESFELAPGGNHVMFMGLTEPVEAGDEVTYTLELEDGSTVDVTSVARPFTGANESYHGGGMGQGGGSASATASMGEGADADR